MQNTNNFEAATIHLLIDLLCFIFCFPQWLQVNTNQHNSAMSLTKNYQVLFQSSLCNAFSIAWVVKYPIYWTVV